MTQDPSTLDNSGPAGDERRRYQRHKIQLSARIEAEGQPAVDCEVIDYCTGGMLIQIQGAEDVESRFGVGVPAKLSTHLQTLAEPRPITIPSTVAWAKGVQLGIAFVRPSDTLAEILSKTKRLQGRVKASPKRKSTRVRRGNQAPLRRVAEARLPKILREFLDNALEALLDAADRPASDTERQQMFTDVQGIEQLRSGNRLFEQVIENAFDPAFHASGEGLNSNGELRLIDTDEFERWLEAARATTRLERRFSEQLINIGKRLMSRDNYEGDAYPPVPFEPKHFAEALKTLAEQEQFGEMTRLVLFDRYVDTLSECLGAFYQALDQSLDQAGLPMAANTPQRIAARPSSSAPPVLADGNQAASAASGNVGEQASQKESGNSLAIPMGNLPAMDAAALARLLEHDREVRQQQAREWFSNVAATHSGTPGVGDWLSKIDPSLLDDVAGDPDFFGTAKHPLHNIVDALEHLQLLRGTTSSPEAEVLNKKVSAILAPLAKGEASSDVLSAVAQEASALSREQSEQYRRNVDRVVEASEGRERVRQAREAIRAELDQRYKGPSVPEVVAELLEVSWRYVLELAWLNKEKKPKRYSKQLEVLDDLVAYLGGKPFEATAPRSDKESLLQCIRSELDTTASDPFRRTAVETRIREELFDTEEREIELVALQQEWSREKITAENERPGDIPEDAWKQVLATCASIRLGDRLIFEGKSEEQQELRVAWMRDDREIYTLVDNQGLRVRDIGLTELAAGIHQGVIRHEAVDGLPMSQRAVEQMLDAMEDRLSQLAAFDSITGLMSRQQFYQVLEKRLDNWRATDASGVLAWIDIDQFKLINDLHGYRTGDRLLGAISKLLDQQPLDKTLAHLGADRFAVLFDAEGPGEIQQWAETLCRNVREMDFDWEGPSSNLTVSIGIVGFAGNAAADGLAAVESALFSAKSAGGDQVHVYQEDDPDISRQRDSVKWVARVDEALVSGELRLRCQPIVPVRPGEGVAPHYEVLLGVTDGAKEALPIAEFIEAAERYKRMRAVDRWITESVFDWIAEHRHRMPEWHGFAVNLSGQTASDPAFVEFVRQQFARTEIDPGWISFEVTETVAVSSLSGTASIVHDLKKLGCKVALDDFGSGQASYSYLRELPVDWLKIDGVFVRNMANNRDDYAVVKSINEIGHFLGKRTIAEFVADQATLECVKELGVDYAQGYGISPPILMSELLTLPQE